jgi:hypothetical protein
MLFSAVSHVSACMRVGGGLANTTVHPCSAVPAYFASVNACTVDCTRKLTCACYIISKALHASSDTRCNNTLTPRTPSVSTQLLISCFHC